MSSVARKPESQSDAPAVFKPYAYQKWLATQKARFLIVMWSRQVGKSMGAALLVVNDILGVEAGGGRTTWTLISRSLLQARELALKVRDVTRAVTAARKMLDPALAERGEHAERQFELTFPGGSRVIVVSGNPDAAAGYTGNVLWDEAALTQRAADLFGTAFPVVSRGDYRFIILSTPRPGFFRSMWDEAGKPDSAWQRDKMTIFEAVAQGCPQDPAQLQKALRRDELRWKQEFLCEFVDDEICWLPWEMIVGCTDNGASVAPVDSANAVYAGWDIARWHNLSVLWLIEKAGARLNTVGVVSMVRMPFEQQYDTVQKACRRYPKFTRLCLDAGGMGEPINETMKRRLGSRVEGVKFNGIKEVLAGDLRHEMEERALRIPDDDEVRDDLHSIRCTTTAAGNKRFEGEIGDSHADRFWAAALAVHAATGAQAAPFKFESCGPRQFGGGGSLSDGSGGWG